MVFVQIPKPISIIAAAAEKSVDPDRFAQAARVFAKQQVKQIRTTLAQAILALSIMSAEQTAEGAHPPEEFAGLLFAKPLRQILQALALTAHQMFLFPAPVPVVIQPTPGLLILAELLELR
jgi:hypothetical protein